MIRVLILCCICMAAFESLHAQEPTILTGKVLDYNGKPMVGASVFVENAERRTLNGTIADNNGNYKLAIPDEFGKLTIVFSFISFKTHRVPYDNRKIINATLKLEESMLEGVVVKGRAPVNSLGITKRQQVSSTQKFNLEAIEHIPMTSLEAGIQGRMANVDIISGADPGSRSSIRIRGTSSLNANSDPLIVIDGVPYPTVISEDFDFATANDQDFGALVNISPHDIASIEVLKDAAATAIWGSRGANGVLVFTTKKGTPGRTRFSFSTKLDMKQEPNTIPLLNGSQYVSLIQDGVWNSINNIGYGAGLSYTELLFNTNEINFDPAWVWFDEYNQNTDWIDEITQFGYFVDNSFSMSGGGDKATYRASLGYMNEIGTTIGTAFNRYNALISVNYRFSNKLQVNADMSYSLSNRKSNWGNPRGIAMTRMPNMSPYVIGDDGERTNGYFTPRVNFQGSYSDGSIFNPVAMVHESVNNSVGENARVIFRLKYRFSPDLQYTGTGGFDARYNKTKKFLPQSVTGVLWTDPNFNRGADLTSDNLYLNTENKFIFNKDLSNDHHLILSGLLQTNEGRNFSYSSETSGNASSFLSDPTSGGTVVGMGSGNSMTRKIGIITNAHYTFKDKYIISGGYRWEANSSLSRTNRWASFPSVGVAWHFGEEKVIKDLGFLQLGKLRFSWGKSGNSPGGAWPYLGVFKPITPGYVDMTAIAPSSIQLERLKWETITQSNIGLDLAMLDNRLFITAEVYDRATTDLLQRNITLPSSTGYAQMSYYNSGELYNRGWEFIFNYDAIQREDLRLSFNFNLSRNRNEVVTLPDNLLFENYEFNNGKYAHKIIENNPIGSFYGYRYLGVYQNVEETYAHDLEGNLVHDIEGEPVFMMNGPSKVYPGDAKYMDVNGDGVINQYDIVYLGNAMPQFTSGGGFNIRYKNLMFSAFFHGRFGQKVVNGTRISTENMRSTSNQSTAVLQRWRHEGDDTGIPRALYSEGYNYLGSDRFVEDASYVRLKTVSLRYSLPKTFLKRNKIERFDIFLTMQNLATWTDYSGQDPEVSLSSNIYMLSRDNASTPRAKRFALGVTINF